MDFSEVGAHCSLPSCRQRDFLPFKCGGCGKVYCLDHRMGSSHDCPQPDRRDVHVVLCPICDASFKIFDGEAGDRLVDEHIRLGGCRKVQNERAAARARGKCHVPRCKRVEVVPIHCKQCGELVCINHRFPADHACGTARQARKEPQAQPQQEPRQPQQPPRPQSQARGAAVATVAELPRAAAGAPPAPARSSAPPAPFRLNGWQCDACTYINSRARTTCEMCANPQPVQQRATATAAAGSGSGSGRGDSSCTFQ